MLEMYRKLLKFFGVIFMCCTLEVECEDLKILYKVHSSYLEKYSSYADAVILNFQVPSDLQFVSFKFEADEMELSIFKCKPQDVSIYVKEGSPPVINPDGSKFPKRLLNVSRPDVRHLQIKSDKTAHYVNLTSPVPGVYFAVAFISWTDPTNAAITQQGLTAKCYTYVDAMLYASNTAAVDIIIPNQYIQATINTTRFFKFYVPEFVDHATIVVSSEELISGNNLTVRIDAKRLPSSENNFVNFTLNNTEMYYRKFWTLEESWHYLELTTSSDIDVNFRLQFFTVTDAISFLQTPRIKNFTKLYRTALQKIHRTDLLTEMIPYKQYNLVKISSSESFLYTYDLQSEVDSTSPTTINLTTTDFTVLKFTVQKGSDVGGSLQFSLAFNSKIIPNHENQIVIGCIRRNAREIPQYPNKCAFDDKTTTAPIMLNKTAENSTIYIPYAEPGIWYASFRLFDGICKKCNCSETCNKQYLACVDDCEANCVSRRDCEACPLGCKEKVLLVDDCKECDCNGECANTGKESNSSVFFDISSYPCLAGRCGRNGRCVFMVSGGFVYSTCVCSNNYRGWDCTDDSLANSYITILVELLLLVLSNIAFIPATYFAFKRKYYMESVVYGSLCFFSTFYHACDAGENIISFCILKVSVLQFADFFTALLSIWVTLLAMADLPSFYPSVFHMTGAIFIAFGITADRWSLWVFAVPAVCGVCTVMARWSWYYKKNRFLPISKKYLYMKLPIGLVLVSIGLVVYAALQTNSNYKYTHSIWHVVMAAAVIVLLPTRDTFSMRPLM